jgi:drug/metabolite transporter (DMT)-like permease
MAAPNITQATVSKAESTKLQSRRLPLTVAAFCILWSSAFAAAKVAMTDSPPLLVLDMRFLIAAAIILGVVAIRRSWELSWRDTFVFAVLGIVNQATFLGLGYVGMHSVSSGLSALIVSANPVLTAVLATWFLNERLTWRKAAGLLLGVVGVAFVVESRLAGGADHPTGIGFTIAALVSLVAGTIVFKKFAPAHGHWTGNGVQSLSAGLATLPFALGFESPSDIVPTWSLFLSVVYLALFVSVLAYLLWFHMLTVWGATAASSYHFLMPPLGLLFGWMLLGEHVARTDLIGIIPVAIGIYLVTRPARVSKTPAVSLLAASLSTAQAAGSLASCVSQRHTGAR